MGPRYTHPALPIASCLLWTTAPAPPTAPWLGTRRQVGRNRELGQLRSSVKKSRAETALWQVGYTQVQRHGLNSVKVQWARP